MSDSQQTNELLGGLENDIKNIFEKDPNTQKLPCVLPGFQNRNRPVTILLEFLKHIKKHSFYMQQAKKYEEHDTFQLHADEFWEDFQNRSSHEQPPQEFTRTILGQVKDNSKMVLPLPFDARFAWRHTTQLNRNGEIVAQDDFSTQDLLNGPKFELLFMKHFGNDVYGLNLTIFSQIAEALCATYEPSRAHETSLEQFLFKKITGQSPQESWDDDWKPCLDNLKGEVEGMRLLSKWLEDLVKLEAWEQIKENLIQLGKSIFEDSTSPNEESLTLLNWKGGLNKDELTNLERLLKLKTTLEESNLTLAMVDANQSEELKRLKQQQATSTCIIPVEATIRKEGEKNSSTQFFKDYSGEENDPIQSCIRALARFYVESVYKKHKTATDPYPVSYCVHSPRLLEDSLKVLAKQCTREADPLSQRLYLSRLLGVLRFQFGNYIIRSSHMLANEYEAIKALLEGTKEDDLNQKFPICNRQIDTDPHESPHFRFSLMEFQEEPHLLSAQQRKLQEKQWRDKHRDPALARFNEFRRLFYKLGQLVKLRNPEFELTNFNVLRNELFKNPQIWNDYLKRAIDTQNSNYPIKAYPQLQRLRELLKNIEKGTGLKSDTPNILEKGFHEPPDFSIFFFNPLKSKQNTMIALSAQMVYFLAGLFLENREDNVSKRPYKEFEEYLLNQGYAPADKKRFSDYLYHLNLLEKHSDGDIYANYIQKPF